MKNPKSILITGASSGIGKALALKYAKEDVVLFISGQNPDRLAETAHECEAKKAVVYSKIISVTAQKEMLHWIKLSDKKQLLIWSLPMQELVFLLMQMMMILQSIRIKYFLLIYKVPLTLFILPLIL